MALLVLALVLVVLGLFPDQEQAIYLTAVGFGLFMGAMTLLAMVFAPQPPQTASGPVAPPATRGSSAYPTRSGPAASTNPEVRIMRDKRLTLATWIAIGVGVGVALGVAMNNLALWLGLSVSASVLPLEPDSPRSGASSARRLDRPHRAPAVGPNFCSDRPTDGGAPGVRGPSASGDARGSRCIVRSVD